MKIKAISAFTAFTGQMNVFNAGDEGELPDAVAAQYIEAGIAEAVADEPANEAAASAEPEAAAESEAPTEPDAPAEPEAVADEPAPTPRRRRAAASEDAPPA